MVKWQQFLKDYMHKKVGKYTIIEYVGWYCSRSRYKDHHVKVRCDCGDESIHLIHRLMRMVYDRFRVFPLQCNRCLLKDRRKSGFSHYPKRSNRYRDIIIQSDKI